jgi:hypothetical protein
VHDHVAKVQNEPAFARLALHAAFFLVIIPSGFQHTLGKRVEHTVTGPVTDDEIIGKRCNVLDVKKQDVFALLVLQGIDDFMGKV